MSPSPPWLLACSVLGMMACRPPPQMLPFGPPLPPPPSPLLTTDPASLLGAAVAVVEPGLLAVGAPGSRQVYLLSIDALADAPVVLQGQEGDPRLGRALTAPGDLDGDGHAEILIASQDAVVLLSGPLEPGVSLHAADRRRTVGDGVVSAAYAGGLLLAAPRADRILWVAPDLATVHAEIHGERSGGLAGGALASAGDVDGDGLEDALVGAWGLEGFRGAAYVVRGPLPADLDLGDAEARFWGEQPWDVAGVAVAGGTDLDGDGRADVWVGAHGYDDGTLLSAGAAYLLQGQPALRGGSLGRLADLRLVGEATEARMGWSLVSTPSGTFVGTPGIGGGWWVTPQARHRLPLTSNSRSGGGGEAAAVVAVADAAVAAVVGAPATGTVWMVPLP